MAHRDGVRLCAVFLVISSVVLAQSPRKPVSPPPPLSSTQVLQLAAELQARPNHQVAALFAVTLANDARVWAQPLTEERWLMLPVMEMTDPRALTAMQQLSQLDLRGLLTPTRPSPPVGATITEAHRGTLHVMLVTGAFPMPGTTKVAPPLASPPTPMARPVLDWSRLLERNLAHVRSPDAVRVLMEPKQRAYLDDLVVAFHPRLLEPNVITFFTPSLEDVRGCEERFLKAVHSDLVENTRTIVDANRAFGFERLFEDFTHSERQVTGWSAGGNRALFVKFRREGKGHGPLTEPYHVKDGGHAFFEFQCQLPTRSLFNVVVHGEA